MLPRADSAGKVIQVEDYIPGREFALEGLMSRGLLRTLAIFDKPDPLEGPFFEETIYVTPSRESAATQHAIEATVKKAAAGAGFVARAHPCGNAGQRRRRLHAGDCRAAHRRALRARPAFPVLDVTGTSPLEEVLVLHAVGEMPPDLSPDDGPNASGGRRDDDSGAARRHLSDVSMAWTPPQATPWIERSQSSPRSRVKCSCPCRKGRATRDFFSHAGRTRNPPKISPSGTCAHFGLIFFRHWTY